MFIEKKLIFKISNPEDINFVSSSKVSSQNSISKQELTEITLILQKQLDYSLSTEDRFIDIQSTQDLLNRLNRQQDYQTLKEVKSEITTRQRNTTHFIQELDRNGLLKIEGETVSLFKDTNLNNITERKQLINNFVELTPTAQEAKLRDIQNYLQQSISQFSELLQLFHGSNLKSELVIFQQLDSYKKEDYIKTNQQLQKNFQQLLNHSSISNKQKEEQLKLFNDNGVEGRKALLEALQEALGSQDSNLSEEFLEARSDRQKQFPDFNLASPTQKEVILKQIRNEIKTEYLNSFYSHKYFYTASLKDIELFTSTFQENNGKFNISTAEACLQWLDDTMNKLHDIHTQQSKYPAYILNHFNWDQLSGYEKKLLLIPGGQVETYYNNTENLQTDKEYKSNLSEYLNQQPLNLINQQEYDDQYKWFQKQSIEKKQNILKNAKENPKLDPFEQTKNDRTELVKNFSELPKSIQKEYLSQISTSDFNKRQSILKNINKLQQSNQKQFNKHLESSLKQKLINPKSLPIHQKHFDKLNLTQQKKYLKQFQADQLERSEIIETFQTEIIPILPKQEIKTIQNKFLNANLKDRYKLIKQLRIKHAPKSEVDKQINQAKTDLQKTKNTPEKTSKLDIKETSIVHEQFFKVAEKYEKQGDTKNALKFYQEALELDIILPISTKQEIQAKIDALTNEQEFYKTTTQKAFTETIELEIISTLSDSPTLLTQYNLLESLPTEQNNTNTLQEDIYDDPTDIAIEIHKESLSTKQQEFLIDKLAPLIFTQLQITDSPDLQQKALQVILAYEYPFNNFI